MASEVEGHLARLAAVAVTGPGSVALRSAVGLSGGTLPAHMSAAAWPRTTVARGVLISRE